MTYRKTMLSASIVAALMFTGAAFAQDTASTDGPQSAPQNAQQTTDQQTQTQKTQEQKAQKLDAVTVVGIRNAAALSLELQKAAVSDINVVTAEDIGKLPAKNVADTLQAIPGVTVGTASAGEGGFDVNERISLRGTAPGLTHTEINGHPLMTGNWFVLNQIQTSGRSANYALLPASIVSEVVVHKSSEAKLNVGGAAGTVNVITRRPLQFGKQVTVHASLGGVYSALPGKTEPQVSALFNYKNKAGTFGLLVQGFYQKRALERYGQEALGFNQIEAGSAIATAHPELAGVWLPSVLDSALFTQKRKRVGGIINLEFKPSDSMTIDFEGFYSRMKADNLNRSMSFWGKQVRNTAAGINNYTIEHNLLTSATFTSPTPALFGVYDQIGRPGAESSTGYISGDLKWNITNRFTFHAQVGVTKGEGKSPTQNVLETNIMATKTSYTMRGLGTPINWAIGDNQFSHPTNASHTTTFGWIFGGQGIDVKGKTDWVSLDGTLDFFNAGALQSLDFGVRYEKNRKGNDMAIGQGPLAGTDYATAWKSIPINATFPGDFNSKLGMSAPEDIWYLSQAQLAQYDAGRVNLKVTSPLYSTVKGTGSRFNPGLVYWVHEKDLGAYFQANFAGDNWAANVGLHYVHTKQNQQYTSKGIVESKTKGPYYTAFFPNGYYLNYHHYTYDKILPSANLKFHLTDDLIARASASQTLTRPAYTALSGAFSLADTDLTAAGGNPYLKPLISTNFDTSLAWYFAPRGLLSIDAFSMQLNNYVDFATHEQTFKDMSESKNGAPVFAIYQVSTPSNIDGHAQGVELAWDQPIGTHFGTRINYTYTSGGASGDRPLKGMSKNVFNVGAYFENSLFHARVSYNYRSSFYMGVDRGADFYMEGTGYLSAEVGFHVTKWFSLNLTGRNLNNPTLKYYAKSTDYGKAPRAFYVNGRQYYLTANFKF